MIPADVALAASALGGSDLERPLGREIASFCRVLTQGSLISGRERGLGQSSPNVALCGLREVIRNSFGAALHV
jgi:hypothetical protein